MFEYHPRDLLIDYVLARPRNHLRYAHVAYVWHHGQRGDHPQVAHVDALAVEGQLQALTVDRHYHQAVEHVHQVGDHGRAEVPRRLVQIYLIVLVVFAFSVFGHVVAQVFSRVSFEGPLVAADKFGSQVAVLPWILTLILVKGENLGGLQDIIGLLQVM